MARDALVGRMRLVSSLCLALLGAAACETSENGVGPGGDGDGLDAGGYVPGGDGGPGGGSYACDPAADDLDLPAGFCALVYAQNLGAARHIAITPSGDVFVAVANSVDGETKGQVVALRDGDGDGVSETSRTFGDNGGNGIAWHAGDLFFAQDDKILRYSVADGELEPSGDPVTVVSGLPSDGDHTAKTVVVVNGRLLVNFGSASNACQEANRERESPGKDPCPELDERAGVWEFDATAINQTMGDGKHFATGTRNLNALALQPQSHVLYGAQNGRDQLHDNWPNLFSAADDARLPAEVLLKVDEGDDFGWPYCYYDGDLAKNVLAPEYGGNGSEVGRCDMAAEPVAVYPAHWAPLGAVFYEGESFPEHYREGLFIANHGSRFAPEAMGNPGYNVIFQPFADRAVAGPYEEFAAGFAGDERPLPDAAKHRPVGVAVGPDGSLYISDDKGGTVWRVIYQGIAPAGPDAGVADGGPGGGTDASVDGGTQDGGAEDGGADDGGAPDGGSSDAG